LIADNHAIYENYDVFLQTNLNEIKELKIVTKTIKEFVNEIFLSSEEYISRAKPQIDVLTVEFYRNPSSDSWNNFAQLLEGIQWLNDMIHTIDSVVEKPNNWTNFIKIKVELDAELENLEEAINNGDIVLIADILKYEILSIFESLETEIRLSIDTEGVSQ